MSGGYSWKFSRRQCNFLGIFMVVKSVDCVNFHDLNCAWLQWPVQKQSCNLLMKWKPSSLPSRIIPSGHLLSDTRNCWLRTQKCNSAVWQIVYHKHLILLDRCWVYSFKHPFEEILYLSATPLHFVWI